MERLISLDHPTHEKRHPHTVDSICIQEEDKFLFNCLNARPDEVALSFSLVQLSSINFGQLP